MKARGLGLSTSRPSFSLSSVLKFILLSSLLFLLLNFSLSLYTSVSTRYYPNFRPPILRISFSPPPPPSSSSSPASAPPLISSVSSSYPIPSKLHLSSPSSVRRGLPKGCDLAKGEWVRDPNAPYYTNSTCRTIPEEQNCMKHGRPDFDFLKWRWKPDGCDLPAMDPAEFLELVRGKSLAFVGDALARNQMQSLVCLLSKVEYPKEIPQKKENRITRMFYSAHNFTLWSFWSPFLVRSEESNRSVSGSRVWHLYLDEPDPIWPAHSAHLHYLVLSTGNSWLSSPCFFHLKGALAGCQNCAAGAAPFMPIRHAHRRAFRTALDAFAGGFRKVAVVRTMSPSHFEEGGWNRGGDCRRTGPFRRRESPPGLEEMEMELYRDQKKEFWKAKWEGSQRGVEFRLMDVTPAMAMRADGHPSKYGRRPEEELQVMENDCVHWCLPGPADMWNDFLFQVLSI
ncbi:hypothetical protein AXF42_Ash003753 [Apostasia shenzhenica]|uniref:Uncharacterized protein n=1 Tax=Apostasia shenzhenica TaxID=1088818 RepID=A0A2I0AI10_9ASPA|nr:hypothetical protein AXF42_Ash003753 [Apostasia shenzhenica]